MSLDRLCTLLEEFERGDIRNALDQLRAEYDSRRGGVRFVEVAGGYQMRTPSDCADYLRRMTRAKAPRFSQSALETLAIVAYRQPVTRSEVEFLRGVDSGGVLKTLLDRRLIRILGRRDIPGRPIIYGTTKEFLELFGLRDLTGLPTLREIQDLSAPPQFEDQQELPLAGAQES